MSAVAHFALRKDQQQYLVELASNPFFSTFDFSPLCVLKFAIKMSPVAHFALRKAQQQYSVEVASNPFFSALMCHIKLFCTVSH